MRELKDVATEILGGNPAKFYVLCGDEYGVKQEYIEHLKAHYDSITEMQDMQSVIQFFSTKQLIPPAPSVYVVRYDADFIKSLSDRTAGTIEKLKIIGTVVCIYEDKRHENAIADKLGDYAVYISPMHEKFMRKHLKARFPDKMHDFIDKLNLDSLNYAEAYNLVLSASFLEEKDLSDMRVLKDELSNPPEATVEMFSECYADKQFAACAEMISRYTGSLTEFYYAMCNVLISMESNLTSKYKPKGPFSRYTDKWDLKSVVIIFDIVYKEIQNSRSEYATEIEDSLLYMLELSLQRY